MSYVFIFFAGILSGMLTTRASSLEPDWFFLLIPIAIALIAGKIIESNEDCK